MSAVLLFMAAVIGGTLLVAMIFVFIADYCEIRRDRIDSEPDPLGDEGLPRCWP